jgi:hypothetical protein
MREIGGATHSRSAITNNWYGGRGSVWYAEKNPSPFAILKATNLTNIIHNAVIKTSHAT